MVPIFDTSGRHVVRFGGQYLDLPSKKATTTITTITTKKKKRCQTTPQRYRHQSRPNTLLLHNQTPYNPHHPSTYNHPSNQLSTPTGPKRPSSSSMICSSICKELATPSHWDTGWPHPLTPMTGRITIVWFGFNQKVWMVPGGTGWYRMDGG